MKSRSVTKWRKTVVCAIVSGLTFAPPLQAIAQGTRNTLPKVAEDGQNKRIASIQQALQDLENRYNLEFQQIRSDISALRLGISELLKSNAVRDQVVRDAQKRAEDAEKAAKESASKLKTPEAAQMVKAAVDDGETKLKALIKRVTENKEVSSEDKAAFQKVLEEKTAQFDEAKRKLREGIESQIKTCSASLQKDAAAVFNRSNPDLASGTVSLPRGGISDALGRSLDQCKDGLRDMMNDWNNADQARQAFQAQAMAMAMSLMAVNPVAAIALMAIVMLMSGGGSGSGNGKNGPSSGNPASSGGTLGTGGPNPPQSSSVPPAPPAAANGTGTGAGILNSKGKGCAQQAVGDTLTLINESDPSQNMSIRWSSIDWKVGRFPKTFRDGGITDATCDFAENRLLFKYANECIAVTPDSSVTVDGKTTTKKAAGQEVAVGQC